MSEPVASVTSPAPQLPTAAGTPGAAGAANKPGTAGPASGHGRPALAIAVGIFALLALAYAATGGKLQDNVGWRDVRAFAETAVSLPAGVDHAVAQIGTKDVFLRLTNENRLAWLPSGAGEALVIRTYAKNTSAPTGDAHANDISAPTGDAHANDISAPTGEVHVSIIARRFAWIAGAAALAFFACLLSIVHASSALGGAFSALAATVSEKGGGLSLARVQMLLWFAIAFAMFSALCVPLLGIPDVDASLAELLGLSGLTTVVGTVTSPPPAAGAETPQPSFRQMIEDWEGALDVTRIQHLALAVVGAFGIVTAFLSTMRVPIVPDGFLTLLGASQATYLGTKAAKQSK